MKIKGIIENSFLDWDGKIATILFTGGCNFKCPFCHNSELVLEFNNMVDIPLEHILDYINQNKKWIDGIVITGGEPLLQTDLIDFLKIINSKNLLVKLDTNGYMPEHLKKIIEAKLIDYIAMDIKTAFNEKKYSKAAGTKIKIDNIIKSTNLLLKNKVPYEFRTTLVKNFVDLEDLINIAEKIHEDSKWAWQNFRHSEELIDKELNKIQPYTNNELDEFENIIKQNFGVRKIIRR